MNKIVCKFLTFLFCTCLCFGCSCYQNKDLIVYKNFYETDVTTFNYILTNEYQNISNIANMIDGLVENDKYGNIVPSVASSWDSEIINGKQVWTFYLKNNVYWSDYKGDKYDLVTAHDFVTTIKYSLNYNIGSNNYGLPATLLENGDNYYNATLIKNYNYNEVVSKIESLKSEKYQSELPIYENIKSVFDLCNSTKECSDDFNTVGIKALDDFTLQFTLKTPVPYFLSTLTYYAFLPANEKFIKTVGFNNFGTNKANLLYNGAYLLDTYYHSNRIELVKNHNYWDKDNVFIDKLIFTKSLNYHSNSYARLSYESGNVSEFILSKEDEVGWDKYVGSNNSAGNSLSPIGNNTYVSSISEHYATYYLVFNQNRLYNSKILTNTEIDVANTALKNTNFRKALLHGLNKELYFNNQQNTSLSSIVPKGFSSTNNKDYTDYLIETYASKKGVTLSQANELFDTNFLFDQDTSSYYLELALEELNLSNDQLPIKLEYTYYYNSDYANYDKARIDIWNAALNGCDNKTDCSYDKIEIVYNDSIKSINDLDNAFYNKQYSITSIGLYPDYNDPTTYLSSLGSKGELYPYMNHNETSYIDNMLEEIQSYYSSDDLSDRYSLCSELEYYMVYELALLLPLSIKGRSTQIVVSDLIPFQKMRASYGLSPFKFKLRKIRTTSYTQEDIKKLREEYEKGLQK